MKTGLTRGILPIGLAPVRLVPLRLAASLRGAATIAAAVLATVGLTTIGFVAPPAMALSLYTAPDYAAYMIDADSGEVLYSRHADAQRFPASITKVMTLYLTFEQLAAGKLRLTDRVVMSRNAAAQAPSKLGLAAGQSLSVNDAIQALTIKSANDVAVALAERISGTEAKFAQLMTSRARELGMKNSVFVNPNGLPDPRHISTARDIAILSNAVIHDFPQYYHYFDQREFIFGNRTIKTHNHLLSMVPGADGLKTGYTRAAGFTLAASAKRNGHRLIAVVLGAPASRARDSNVESLLQAGFQVLDARRRGSAIHVADMLAEPGDLNDAVLTDLMASATITEPARTRGRR